MDIGLADFGADENDHRVTWAVPLWPESALGSGEGSFLLISKRAASAISRFAGDRQVRERFSAIVLGAARVYGQPA